MSRDDYLIERANLGEASPEEEAYLRSDPVLVKRLQDLDKTNALFRATYPAEEQLEAIHRKIHVATTRDAVTRRNRALGTLGVLVPLATAAGVMLFAPELVFPKREIPMEHRTKGDHDPALGVFLQRDDGKAVELKSGSVAQAGDVLQLSYKNGGASHGVVLSVDGGGTVSLHHPSSVGGNTALEAGTVDLPHGYELDDAPRFERFFFVTSDAPIDVRAVLAAAQALPAGDGATAQLPLAEGLQQTSFMVRKAER